MNEQQNKFLFASACLGLLLFGITLTTLGSILPAVIVRFEISMTEAGFLFTLLNVGILAGSLIFGPIVDRFGYKKLMVVCSLLILTGMEGVAFSSSFFLFSISVVIFGFGGGMMNGAANALVSDISEGDRSAKLALLGVFFGIGAFSVPLMLGALLNHFTYTHIIATLGIIVLLAVFIYMRLTFPKPKQPHSFPVKEALALVKHPELLLLAFILFFQSGMEMTTGGWTAAYFQNVLNLEASAAVILLSFFWIGMMLSRLAISRILKWRAASIIIKTSMAIAMTGAIILLNTNHPAMATFSIFLLGAGFAAVFPLLLAYIGDLYPGMTGTAFSLAFTIALFGGMLFPYIAGVAGDLFGLRSSFILIPAGLMATYILFMVALKRLNEYHPQIQP